MRDYQGEMIAYLSAKRLCIATVEVYKTQLRNYLNWCIEEKTLPEDVSHEGIVRFLALEGSDSACGQKRAMLVNLYEFVLGQGYKMLNVPYAKKRIKLPESLSPEQIQQIFNAVSYPKQRLILKIMYACALRVSEAVKIHLDNFRPKKNIKTGVNYFELKITGKGIKERLVPVPNETMNEIASFIEDNQIEGYLFKGQFKDFYSTKSVQLVFERAKQKCGITTPGNTHLLRKSRTAHFIDGNMNDRNVMLMMGWENIKTINHYHRANTSAMKDGIDAIDEQIKSSLVARIADERKLSLLPISSPVTRGY